MPWLIATFLSALTGWEGPATWLVSPFSSREVAIFWDRSLLAAVGRELRDSGLEQESLD